MSDAALGLIVSLALAVVGSGGLVALVKLLYDIRTGHAAEQRKSNRDAVRDSDALREVLYATQARMARIEVLAIAAGVPADKIPAAVDTSRLFPSDH